jgi:hypothetical protein
LLPTGTVSGVASPLSSCTALERLIGAMRVYSGGVSQASTLLVSDCAKVEKLGCVA